MGVHRAWARWAAVLVGTATVSAPGCLRRSVDPAATPVPVEEVSAHWFPDASTVEGVDLDERGRVAVAGAVLDTAGGDERAARARGARRGAVSILGPDGRLQWSVVASGRSGMRLVRHAPDGGVVATGWFEEEVDFGCGPVHAETGSRGSVVVKFDAEGRCRWSQRLPGFALPEGLAVDAAGEVYVVGEVDSPRPDWTPSDGLGFVARYDAEGEVRWVRYPLPGSMHFVGVVADGDRIAFVARMGDRAIEDERRHPRQALLLLDGAGEVRWRHDFGREPAVAVGGLKLGEGGALFVGGWFAHRLVLGDNRLVARHGWDAFLARLEHDGTVTWSIAFEDEGDVFAAPTRLGPGGDLHARVVRLRSGGGGAAPAQPGMVLLTLDTDGRILEARDLNVTLSRCAMSLALGESDLVVGVTTRVDRPCEDDTWPAGRGGVIRHRLGR